MNKEYKLIITKHEQYIGFETLVGNEKTFEPKKYHELPIEERLVFKQMAKDFVEACDIFDNK